MHNGADLGKQKVHLSKRSMLSLLFLLVRTPHVLGPLHVKYSILIIVKTNMREALLPIYSHHLEKKKLAAKEEALKYRYFWQIKFCKICFIRYLITFIDDNKKYQGAVTS